MVFRWNDWNSQHIARHGVAPEAAEHAILQARPPWPLYQSDEKWLVWGQDQAGRHLQVVFVLEEDECVFVIHARPLTEREKKLFRKRKPT